MEKGRDDWKTGNDGFAAMMILIRLIARTMNSMNRSFSSLLAVKSLRLVSH